MLHRNCGICRTQRWEILGAILSLAVILGLMFGLPS